MTQTTQNKERRVVVEVSSSDPFNKTDIQNAMDDLFNKHGGEPYTVTEIDMTQYVSRAKVQGTLDIMGGAEINPYSYDYDDVCNLNDKLVEAYQFIETLLTEGGNDEQ